MRVAKGLDISGVEVRFLFSPLPSPFLSSFSPSRNKSQRRGILISVAYQPSSPWAFVRLQSYLSYFGPIKAFDLSSNPNGTAGQASAGEEQSAIYKVEYYDDRHAQKALSDIQQVDVSRLTSFLSAEKKRKSKRRLIIPSFAFSLRAYEDRGDGCGMGEPRVSRMSAFLLSSEAIAKESWADAAFCTRQDLHLESDSGSSSSGQDFHPKPLSAAVSSPSSLFSPFPSATSGTSKTSSILSPLATSYSGIVSGPSGESNPTAASGGGVPKYVPPRLRPLQHQQQQSYSDSFLPRFSSSTSSSPFLGGSGSGSPTKSNPSPLGSPSSGSTSAQSFPEGFSSATSFSPPQSAHYEPHQPVQPPRSARKAFGLDPLPNMHMQGQRQMPSFPAGAFVPNDPRRSGGGGGAESWGLIRDE